MDFPHPGPGFNPDYRVFNVPKAFDLFHPPPPHFVADPGLAASADTFKASAERPGMRRVAGMGPDFERLQHDAIVHRQVNKMI